MVILTQNIITWGGINIFLSNRVSVTSNKILSIILNVKIDANDIPLMSVYDMYSHR